MLYRSIGTRKNHSDNLEIKEEVLADDVMDSYKALEALEKEIKGKLRIILGLDAKITLVSPNTLQRFEGKAKRVTDLRNETI